MRYTDLLDTLARDTTVESARLLILMDQLGASNAEMAVRGISKLATLDFLLANPTYLARALSRINRSTKTLQIAPFEGDRASIESAYLAFEPWDHAHRRVVAALLARSLIAFAGVNQGALQLYLTEQGQNLASLLSATSEFEVLVARAKLLRRDFDLEPRSLQSKVVRLLPELQTLLPQEPIAS